ncbi:MAG: M48 family metalloprotease [Candidatus Symbiodolus clandestinus]
MLKYRLTAVSLHRLMNLITDFNNLLKLMHRANKRPWKRAVGLLCLLFQQSPMLLALPSPLPELGSAASFSLSIEQERLCGELVIRKLRGQKQLLHDPLLDNYLAGLGQRLRLHAGSLQYPLQFYWLPRSDMNAFALVGGYLMVYTSLLQVTECEDELAAVLAHEIVHIMQRHTARMITAQKAVQPLAWAAVIGSVMLALTNPMAGMAAFSATLGGVQQQALIYSQAHEAEADRIGINLLVQAGFDPQAMPNFLVKLAQGTCHAGQVPEILLTHPLPQRRIAEARGRAYQQKQVRRSRPSLEYFLAKIRYQQLYAGKASETQLAIPLSSALLSALDDSSQALLQGYHQALQCYRQRNYEVGRKQLRPLLQSYPDNIWLLDALTDIDLAQRRYHSAVQRLLKALQRQPEQPILLLNLANVYLQQGENTEVIRLLRPYCHRHPHSSLGWHLLAQAYAGCRLLADEQAAQAEWLALQGEFKAAQQALRRAHQAASQQPLQQERYQVRLEQLQQYQHILEQAKNL